VSRFPLKAVETDFAVDATGFSTSRFVRWYDAKYGRKAHSREWFKCHMVCGVKTKVITAVDISGWQVHDSYFFDPLVRSTAKHFEISELAADKAYLGRRNMETVEALGGTPYIMFKKYTVEPKDDSIWAKMYRLFMYNREAFMWHYHKRSNAESAFSMMKGKKEQERGRTGEPGSGEMPLPQRMRPDKGGTRTRGRNDFWCRIGG
jgi:transposase